MQGVTLFKRSSHCSFNKSTCKGGCSTKLQENKQQCAGMACSFASRNQSSLNLLSTFLFVGQEHYGLCSQSNAISGLSTLKGLNISDFHHLVSTFHRRGILNTSFYPSPFQTGRTLNHLPLFCPFFPRINPEGL